MGISDSIDPRPRYLFFLILHFPCLPPLSFLLFVSLLSLNSSSYPSCSLPSLHPTNPYISYIHPFLTLLTPFFFRSYT
ncbi:hypothetical protein BKA57DRAFT_194777 [Linnemannia elongata]|nr:hypothetical protein BKA57DRAFT_194777 [Linnemannia elongata]